MKRLNRAFVGIISFYLFKTDVDVIKGLSKANIIFDEEYFYT